MSTRSPKELQSDIARAVQILELFTDPSKRDVQLLIPQSILQNAHGLVFIRLYRGGFMVSAKKGTGIIIARLPDGSWSAPSGISMGALGFGHQAGVEVIDSIIVMNYRGAVKAFFDQGGQLQLGANASISAGPLGRAANISAGASGAAHMSATYAYSASKGLFAGYSFEGSKISERVNTNAAFYGRTISAREILTGGIQAPPQAQRLYQILYSLGAGPRPGLPFAPKKGSSMARPSSQPPFQQGPPQQQPPYGSPVNMDGKPYNNNNNQHMYNTTGSNSQAPVTSPGAIQQQANINNNEQGMYDEPPPPYMPSEQPNMFMGAGDTKQTPTTTTASPPTGDTKQTLYNTPNDGGTNTTQTPYNDYSGPKDNNSGNSSTQPIGGVDGNAPAYNMSGSGAFANYQPDQKQQPPIMDPQQQTVVVAKYDYVAQQPGDLSFSAGDHIIVTQRKGDRQCWWEGQIGERIGMFPANYTEDMEF